MNQRYVSKDLEDLLIKKFENYYSTGNAWFPATIHVFPLYIAIFKKYAINKEKSSKNYLIENFLEKITSLEFFLKEFIYFKENNVLSKEEMDRFETSLQHLLNFDINEWKSNKDYQINESTKEQFYYVVYLIVNFVKYNSYIFTLIRDYEKFDFYKLLVKDLK